MSLTLTLKQAPEATLDLLVERPELAIVFWMNPDYIPPKTPLIARIIARVFGGYTPPMELPEAPPELARNGEELRLDRSAENLLKAIGEPPLNERGRAIRGSHHGYGDERALDPQDVSALANTLPNQALPLSDDDLSDDLNRLNEFVQATSSEALGLVIQLS